MIRTVQPDMLVDLVHEPQAVFGEEGQDREESLLQVLVRIEQVRQVFGFGTGPVIAPQRFLRDFALDLRELIQDLRTAPVERRCERLVESVERQPQVGNLLRDGSRGRCHARAQFVRDQLACAVKSQLISPLALRPLTWCAVSLVFRVEAFDLAGLCGIPNAPGSDRDTVDKLIKQDENVRRAGEPVRAPEESHFSSSLFRFLEPDAVRAEKCAPRSAVRREALGGLLPGHASAGVASAESARGPREGFTGRAGILMAITAANRVPGGTCHS